MPARWLNLLAVASLGALAGCSSADVAASTGEVPPPAAPSGRSTITIRATDAGTPIDPRLFGTNVPAWMRPERLNDPRIRDLTRALGSRLLRLPGGSWSNHYDWLKCENGDSNGCFWTWASKPTDFLNFVKAVGAEAMWTVSFNGTSKEAAALVAFFNGSVNDTTLIGIDVRGRDWKRVQDWAMLRASHGNREPFRITLWEVGNEIYGAKPAFGGSTCASWGWEEVWTCDGNEYMRGKGSGDTRREGYLEFRTAMRAVDSTIKVGAVGVDLPGEWWDWGNKVIRNGGADLDFYVIHNYGFNQQPKSVAEMLARPQGLWKKIFETTNASFDQLGARRRVPIAVTEYNLAAFQELDNGQLMTRAANGLFIADMIGQLAVHGASIANQWNLANGRAGNGTDYGMIDADNGKRSAQYYAMRLWTTAGNTLLPLTSPLPDSTTLSTYATRHADGSYSILAINKTGAPIDVRIDLAGVTTPMTVSADVLEADSLEATDVRYNGRADPRSDFSNAPSKGLGVTTGPFDYAVPRYSVTVIRFKP